MIIRQLQPKDCFAAKSLWQEIFQDTEPFANFFFSRRFTPTLSFGAFDGDDLVSMALGRRVRMENPPLKAVMISGVSTLPSYRHQGLMTEVLTRLIVNAKRRGYDLAALSPVDPALYQPFGFMPLTYAIRAAENSSEHPEITETKDPEVLLRIYKIVCAKHFCMLRREEKDMRLAVEEYRRDDGIFLLAPDEQGYLCYLPEANRIEVTECVALSGQIYRDLLEAAASRSPSGTATADLPTECGMSGTLIRPVYALPLKEGLELGTLTHDRRSFCIERY